MSPLALLVAGTFFMELLDGSIIATALPHMAAELGTTAVQLEAAVSVYLITVAVFIVPSGWMADKFGPRMVFTVAIALFTLSSVLCGLSQSPAILIAGRALQGLGGAMMVPVGRLVVLRATAKPDLMRAIAILTWPGLTAPLLGPPLGGFISEYLSWRWIFFINLPLGILGILLALWLMPKERETAVRPFDAVGFVLAGSLVGLVMLGVNGIGQSRWPALGLLAFAAAIACLATALTIHLRRHPHPIIDRVPFAFATFRAAVIGGTCIRTLISAVPFMLPLMFQLGFGLDAFHAGLLMFALFAGNIGIKPATSIIIRAVGFRFVLVANGLVQAATMAACALLSASTSPAVVIALLVLSGASRSLQFTALNSIAFADVPQPAMSGANTIFSTAFQTSLGLGVALGAGLIKSAALVAGGDPLMPILPAFQLAFLILGMLTVLAAINHARLPADAGAAVSGGRRPR